MFVPKYTITHKILKNIGTVEAAREVIVNAPLVPAWEAKFREEAIVRTVHHGTHIEGNELNFTEASKVLAGQQIVGRERDIQEVINYRHVIAYIEDFKPQALISEDAIKHIHALTVERLLDPALCGAYRSTQVVVKNSQTGEITFRPPPAIEVPYQMEDFLNWLGDEKTNEIHPVIAAGITHYELVRIHPFLDGNGRVARATATLVLFTKGYDIKRFFSLEEYYDRDAMRYYGSLQSVGQDGDMTAWIEYFVEGLAIELIRIKEKVQRLSVDLRLKDKLGGVQMALNERQIKIVEHIQNTGFLTNKSFKELFPMISEDTVLRDLKDLIEKHIIEKEGVTKAARYVMK
jgi:Fic family protein